MIFTKTEFYRAHRSPIDRGKVLADGKRLFGNNKTWIGFVSMVLFCILFQVGFGFFCNGAGLNAHCDIYQVHRNTWRLNVLFGGLTGLVYMLSELPNSCLKRRLDIRDGKTERGCKGLLFFVVDQIDSLIGVMLLVYWFSDITIGRYFCYVLLGGLTHIMINSLLYLARVRKNI